MNGWPNYVQEPELQAHFSRRNELTIEQGIILWGMRVIVPEQFQKRLIEEMHEGHIGM